ncbi:MAG: thiamine phosphate synthase [Nitrosomonas sp.]
MPIKGLYAITPDLSQTDELLDKVKKALQGGVTLLQYRNKLANNELLREQAQALLALCRQYHVPMIINDHLDLAIEIDADGVHLGQEDLTHDDVNEELARYDKILGISCYNSVELALQAQDMEADYLAFGAFFPSVTKPDAVTASINLVKQTKKHVTIPIVGIGGIRLSNAAEIIQAGCAAVAVSDDLFNAPDIQDRARQFQQLFGNAA